MDQNEMQKALKWFGTKELPGFVATEHELMVLVKYWTTYDLDNQYSFFLYGHGYESREGLFCGLRIKSIECVLGEELTERACREAVEEFRSKCDRRHWDIFVNGTPEQREALQDEMLTGVIDEK